MIWFDLPRATCVLGILMRIAKSYGQVRALRGASFEARPDV